MKNLQKKLKFGEDVKILVKNAKTYSPEKILPILIFIKNLNPFGKGNIIYLLFIIIFKQYLRYINYLIYLIYNIFQFYI